MWQVKFFAFGDEVLVLSWKNGAWKSFVGWNISFFTASKNLSYDNEYLLLKLHVWEQSIFLTTGVETSEVWNSHLQQKMED